MRICFIIGSLARGGAERQLINLARHLRKNGHTIHVISLKPLDSENPLTQQPGIEYYSLNARNLLHMVVGVFKLRRLIHRVRPDVVHSYLPMSNVIAGIMRVFLPPLKLVWGVRDSHGTWEGYRFHTKMFARLERLLSHVPDLIIANSQAGFVNLMFHTYKAPIEVIRNGIDTQTFSTTPARNKRAFHKELNLNGTITLVGMVTRVKPVKDIETYIAAAAIAYAHNPALRFVLVGDGDGDYLERLRNKVAAHNLDDVFRFYQAVDDPARIYRALDIHMLTSVSEGFPNTLCEAMACGTPCVSTRAGDAETIVSRHGELFPIGNITEAAESIRRLVKRISTNEKKLRTQSRAHIVANFSCKKLAENTQNMLQRILSQ